MQQVISFSPHPQDYQQMLCQNTYRKRSHFKGAEKAGELTDGAQWLEGRRNGSWELRWILSKFQVAAGCASVYNGSGGSSNLMQLIEPCGFGVKDLQTK